MRKTKLNLITAVLILAFTLIHPAVSDNQITFTDAAGRDISLNKPAESITYYMVGDAIRVVGAWNKVVARDGISDNPKFFPNYQSIPAISSGTGYMDLDFEKIVELNPDVMIIGKQDWDQEGVKHAIDTLEPEIPVVVLDFVDPDTMTKNYANLGVLTGHSKEADAYISYYNGVIDTIRAKTKSLSDKEKPFVFIQAHGMSSPDERFTYGSGFNAATSLMKIAGVKNTASDLSGAYVEFNPEWLINKDIDVVLKEVWANFYPDWVGLNALDPSTSDQSAQSVLDASMQDEVFAGTDAVKENRIHLIDHDLWKTPVIYLAYLAKWSHPDLFPDLDPEAVYQEYLSRFMRSDYDLQTVGVIGK